MIRTLLRVIAWLTAILLGLLALALLVATLLCPFEYVRRVIAWGQSDVKDYLENFPERATGVSVREYTQEKLWKPLGMEFSGSWSLDSEAGGFEKMEAGLSARAIDFAKLGRLYLENGNWDGVPLVPAGVGRRIDAG